MCESVNRAGNSRLPTFSTPSMPSSSAMGTDTAERTSAPRRGARVPGRSSMSTGLRVASTQPAMPSPSRTSRVAHDLGGRPSDAAMRIAPVSGSSSMMLPVAASDTAIARRSVCCDDLVGVETPGELASGLQQHARRRDLLVRDVQGERTRRARRAATP